MARIDLPQSKLKSRRRRRRFVVLGIFVVVVLAVVGALAGISHAPFLRITTIDISGTKTLATSTLDASVQKVLADSYWYLFAKDNILLYPNATIVEELLKKYPTLKNVEVHANDFHTIGVTVVERDPKALWCSGPSASCYLMDEDGVVYAHASGQEPFITYQGKATGSVPAQFLTSAQFHSLVALAEALMQTTPNDLIHLVVVDANSDVRVYFQKDFLLMFSLNDKEGDVFERFSLALKSDPFVAHKLEDFEYLDLRFGDKLYYKLKSL